MTSVVPLLAAATWCATLAMLAPASRQHSRIQVTLASDTLVRPPVLANISTSPHTVEVRLTAAVARLPMVPGHLTEVYAFNGQVPGPTLEVHEGDRVIVHYTNSLPEPSTVHWHGIHLPSDMDGSPMYPVAPGEKHDYIFTIHKGTAGTYRDHPHLHHRTGFQIAKGLYGAIIVRAADDPLPASLPEKLLILADNRFLADGSVDLPDPHTAEGLVDEENGREGNVMLVNGKVMPTITIRSGEVQRWRVINASAARVYRLAIPGLMFLHVGNDGGLFEKPVEVKEIVLANSERVELLIRGIGPPGSHTTLQTLPYDRYDTHTRPKDWTLARDLVTLQYSSEKPVTPVKLPATLRHIPVLDTAQATATRVIVMSQGLINGRVMDMNRSDVISKLGTTEIWQIENVVTMDHPFHLHGFQFQVLDRNGVPERYRSWKDAVNVPKHESVRFIVRYEDFSGRWMFHCHILDHEDHGMMGILELK